MIILIIYSFIIGMSYQAKKNDRFYFFRKSFLDSSQNFSEIPQISETIPRCLSQLNEKYLPLSKRFFSPENCGSGFSIQNSWFIALGEINGRKVKVTSSAHWHTLFGNPCSSAVRTILLSIFYLGLRLRLKCVIGGLLQTK